MTDALVYDEDLSAIHACYSHALIGLRDRALTALEALRAASGPVALDAAVADLTDVAHDFACIFPLDELYQSDAPFESLPVPIRLPGDGSPAHPELQDAMAADAQDWSSAPSCRSR
ncbi:hypothetical protein MPH_09186 [Macrophomina phaseolina MS6]|uniref:Uncharacterized protein n=1 Tax=Macrophomina phaseolina (strain MS6) TaxID=1126212 RepID=K2SA12_MACPH|nr:hypothetical protein MPH_09186 [Macrophomina phaseolina MS6]